MWNAILVLASLRLFYISKSPGLYNWNELATFEKLLSNQNAERSQLIMEVIVHVNANNIRLLGYIYERFELEIGNWFFFFIRYPTKLTEGNRQRWNSIKVLYSTSRIYHTVTLPIFYCWQVGPVVTSSFFSPLIS